MGLSFSRPLLALLLIAGACAGDVGAGGGSASPPGKPGNGSGARDPMSGPGANPSQTTPPVPETCKTRPALGRAPLRRLTRFEYNNTVRDLLGDETFPGNALPPEEVGNGFGNDAAAQAVSSLLAEQYAQVAEDVARRATQSSASLQALHPCAEEVAAGAEEGCAEAIIRGWVPRAFRRPLESGDTEVLLGLYRATRDLPGASFGGAVAAVVEAVLQSPDFLYRIERGVPAADRPGWLRPSGQEMATRLSYFLWGTQPDQALRVAAESGRLDSAAGVLAEATRMLEDPRARRTFRFFAGNLLPLTGLGDLERDEALFPTFTPAIGGFMQEETQRLLEHELFEGTGTWAAALTAPHTFVNRALAEFYGLARVGGTGFEKVPVNTALRLGFLTHASLMAGTTHSNHTNPVVRGSFVLQKLLCMPIPLPDASLAEKIKPPDPYAGKTARARFTQHQQDAACRTCHSLMDPVGFALENFDPVGLYRTHENGVPIDATGALPGVDGPINGPVELARELAALEGSQRCLAQHLVSFAFGKTLGPEDACLLAEVNAAFAEAGYDVQRLLLALTQTEPFLYLAGPSGEGN